MSIESPGLVFAAMIRLRIIIRERLSRKYWILPSQNVTEEYYINNQFKKLADELPDLVSAQHRQITKRAIKFAQAKHERQFRLGGEPQVCHVLRVGIRAAKYARENCPGKILELVLTSLLHDIIEDTKITPEEFRKLFGQKVFENIVALSHIEEEEPDEVYLTRVAAAGRIAVLVKRFDRLDNIESLANAPVEFRQRKLVETRNALPIWSKIDPDGAQGIEKELERYGTQNTG